MKKRVLLGMLMTSMISVTALSQDLAVGNVSAGINSYNQSTGEISGAYFDVLNNDNSSASSFRIAIILRDANNWDPSDPSTFHEIASIDDLDGQSGNTVVTYSNVYIDINNTPNIPAGDYRVLVCVDADDEISETNESNNCLYITTPGNNITYIPNSASIDNDSKNKVELLAFPNPVKDVLNFTSTNKIQGEIEIYNVLGVLVYSNMVEDDHITVDTKSFEQGTYLCVLRNTNGMIVSQKKFVKL